MFDEFTTPEAEPVPPAPRFGARLIPWLLLVALALLFVPLYIGSITLTEAVAPLATESTSLQATITAPPDAPAQEQTLTAHLLDLRFQLAGMEDIPATMMAAHIDWPAIMSALRSYDAGLIRLTGFSRVDNHLILEGSGLEESAILKYASNLQGTGYFSGVSVQSIRVNPTPPALPGTQTDGALPDVYMPFVFTLSVDLKEVSSGSH